MLYDGNSSDIGLNDRILDEELMKPLGTLVASERNLREQLFATGVKERGRNECTLFEQMLVIANCLDNAVDNVLWDCHRVRHLHVRGCGGEGQER